MPFKSSLGGIFRNSFSERIFAQKYKHDGALTWDELAGTLTEDVVSPNSLSYDDKQEVKRIIREGKFIPGGRYLYYAGRKKKFYNNCLAGWQRILTRNGWQKLEDIAGQTVQIHSPRRGGYLPATIVNHGFQDLYTITFKAIRGKSKKEYVVHATRDHRWKLIDGQITDNIQIGNVVPANAYTSGFNYLGYLHGLIFADGSLAHINKKSGEYVNKIRLCDDKNKLLVNMEECFKQTALRYTVTYPPTYNGDAYVHIWCDFSMKTLPDETADPAYISAFIQGWKKLDGYEKDTNMLASTNEEAIDYFIENAAYAGLVITGEKRSQTRDTQYKNNSTLYIVNYANGYDWQGFKVTDIQYHGVNQVYCPYEPVFNEWVTDHNMVTLNCFLFKSKEDTREDWADLSYKAELCLSTGGGIGNDYSIYRGAGAPLHGTGGIASGPIPKMDLINSIGQNIIQGGSRRSAIYASLNWKHHDILTFLKAKDWHNMPVAGTDKTIWDLKMADFNFKAPLDMTNISINWDTDWLLNYMRTNDVGQLFLDNCKQALSTGEPGFSFNFFDKENETARNACTEVTSEDDSDVCNLGSINLANIDTLDELVDTVKLGTYFLLCGTLVAELPYQRVYDIRQKNRRLGLGLMGVHEWLIKRGYRYEVVPELHDWLSVYEGVSRLAANELSDRLSISRPVAVRAIAPTGSIGILAGTTTGIEPIFATAFKRRYLKGKTWQYEYVLDATAEQMIDLYGTDPDKIETALDLAKDYERRIKFQADIQDYVDMSISSTINMPAWGTELNNEDTIKPFAQTLAKYASRLRGFTCYPDGSRGGQPLVAVPYLEAKEKTGQVFTETVDICDITGRGGSCGT